MKKIGIRVILVVVLSLVMLLGTVSVARAEKPNRVFTVDDVWYDATHLYVDVTCDGYRIYGYFVDWYKWDEGANDWDLHSSGYHPEGELVAPLPDSRTLMNPLNISFSDGEKWQARVRFLRKNLRPWRKPIAVGEVEIDIT